MNTRNAIATGLCALALAGGGAASASSPAGAATTHTAAAAPQASAGTSSHCIIFSKTYVPGVHIRAWHNTSSRVEGTATPEIPYTTDHCKIAGGSWYHACGLTSDKWEPIRLHGRWYWTAAKCWAPTIRL